VDACRAVLDAYAETLRERIRGVSPPREVLLTINQFLFETVGLEGNETDYYAPENSYLNLVLDRRTGNPINVCLVYLVIARRLQLPITGIGMPGHFVCRYQSSVEEIYIDAFNAGRLLTKADCVKYLLQSSYGFQEGLLAPASPRRILLRICSNLHQTYLHLKLRDETARIQRYIVALAS
jgi:regulator of sirC expression with transglutaminase-like and TPR domain